MTEAITEAQATMTLRTTPIHETMPGIAVQSGLNRDVTDRSHRRIIGYTRVSTDKQAETGASLQAQREKVQAMATVHDGRLLEIVEDAGESAKTLARPGLARVLALVNAGAVDMLIVSKLDRLTRSVRDLCDLIALLEKRKVALVSVAEALDTSSAAGRLVLNIMASVSQWEREAISERTKTTMASMKRSGRRVGNLQFGYRMDGDRVVADDHEQVVIARACALRSAGHSLRRTAAALNQEGFRTRRGGPWREEYVRGLRVSQGIA